MLMNHQMIEKGLAQAALWPAGPWMIVGMIHFLREGIASSFNRDKDGLDLKDFVKEFS